MKKKSMSGKFCARDFRFVHACARTIFTVRRRPSAILPSFPNWLTHYDILTITRKLSYADMIFNKNNEKGDNMFFSNFGRPNTSNPPPPSTSGFVRIFRTPPRGGRPDVLCECPLKIFLKEFIARWISTRWFFANDTHFLQKLDFL